MKIEVRCFATLACHAPADNFLHDVPESSTLQELMDMLGIPTSEVKILFINGVQAEPESRIKNGDRVGFFPAVGGG